MTRKAHPESPTSSTDPTERAATGIPGLDIILRGGLPRNHAYLIQGRHGAGKTTLALQFLLAGAREGERALYVSTSESEEEIHQVARSHGWSLDGVEIHYHDPRESFPGGSEQSVFHPAEVELPRIMEALGGVIQRADPRRLAIDSLSEIRLLSPEGRWFRRAVLALKHDLQLRRCTTLLCDDLATPDQPVHSIVHGIIDLEQKAPDYGPARRRLRVVKLRGSTYASGYHDFRIETGGIRAFPRLVAAEHRDPRPVEVVSTGHEALDELHGGGIDRGSAALFLGPSGSGKSILATQFVRAAAERGEEATFFVFDERVQTFLHRARGIGLPLEEQIREGRLEVRQVDPAEMSPGEFGQTILEAVEGRGVQHVVLDSLAGYRQAMPDERSLSLHLHELLSVLNQKGVTVLMIMTQHGLLGGPRTHPFDISYIADSVVLFHVFEYDGELRRALSVYKRRGGAHELQLRALGFGPDGVRIGEPFRSFSGITTGLAQFSPETPPGIRTHAED